MRDFSIVLNAFSLEGKIGEVVPFGNGHIHDTYQASNSDLNKPDYLLQRINHSIFKAIPEMMENIFAVTNYLTQQAPDEEKLQLIPTKDGLYFHQDAQGNYWRVFLFLKNRFAFDVAATTKQIYEGAKAFGNFLYQLRDFPVQKLHITIPNFHDVVNRLTIFENIISKENSDRVKETTNLIKFIRSHSSQMSTIQNLGNAGKIPLRVTHNDTKFNNVLLDVQGKGKCVIDLDTVMPGYVHFDFGDGVRTSVMTAAEDEADLTLIQTDLERFEAFTTGYLSTTKDLLIPIEKEYLALSGPLLSYIMGLRFLTDYLAGDPYYKIHFEKQNLQRATAQLNLTQKLLDRLPELQRIVAKQY